MSRPVWNRMGWIVLALALGVTIFAPSLTDPTRFTAQVAEPFEIDGEVYPPGRLTIRTVDEPAGATLLCEISVGRESLGMFRAVRSGPAGPPAALEPLRFARSPGGRPTLDGFTVGRATDRQAYRFDLAAARDTTRVARR